MAGLTAEKHMGSLGTRTTARSRTYFDPRSKTLPNLCSSFLIFDIISQNTYESDMNPVYSAFCVLRSAFSKGTTPS